MPDPTKPFYRLEWDTERSEFRFIEVTPKFDPVNQRYVEWGYPSKQEAIKPEREKLNDELAELEGDLAELQELIRMTRMMLEALAKLEGSRSST